MNSDQTRNRGRARRNAQASHPRFAVTGLVLAVGGLLQTTPAGAAQEVAPGVLLVGRLANARLTECSGLVASRQYPGVFWTHNDGGGKRQFLHAVTREGKSLAEFYVTGTLVQDWEDIAIDDERRLYVGDIGNNDARRRQLAVYRLPEPDPKGARGSAVIERGWQLRFPGAPFDCESLFVRQGHGYVVSKVFQDRRAEIYRFPLKDGSEPLTLELVARLRISSPVTGADLSTDGRLLGLVAKSGAFVYRVEGDVASAAQLAPHHVKLRRGQVEGCCFVPEGLLASSETRELFLFTDPAFRPEP
jgi:hypothetical protein